MDNARYSLRRSAVFIENGREDENGSEGAACFLNHEDTGLCCPCLRGSKKAE